MSKKIIVAIDGPAGSGKSTAAKLLAEKLGCIYLDTGAMYRAITYTVLANNVADDIDKLISLVRSLDIKLEFKEGVTVVFVNGENVTDKIRTPEVNAKVSDISKIPEVRAELVKIQRSLGEKGSIVAEGRDTTTVVFPEADVKIYLTAELDTRAQRRLKEFLEKDQNVTLEDVKENLNKRDTIDSSRKVSPLRIADDAIEFDNNSIPIDKEIDQLVKMINEILEDKSK